jgi:hypothetical protein
VPVARMRTCCYPVFGNNYAEIVQSRSSRGRATNDLKSRGQRPPRSITLRAPKKLFPRGPRRLQRSMRPNPKCRACWRSRRIPAGRFGSVERRFVWTRDNDQQPRCGNFGEGQPLASWLGRLFEIRDQVVAVRLVGDAGKRHPVPFDVLLRIGDVGIERGRIPDDIAARHRG